MRCPKSGRCGGKGYIEDWYHYADQARPMLRQCCDVSAYSARVQLLAQGPEEAFKSYGRKSPIIARHMNVTSRGIETKKGPENPEGGKACEVIPLRRT